MSLDSGPAATKALDTVCEPHGGQAPDAVITCAGSSKPMFLVEMEEQDLVDGMMNGYWIQAWTGWVSNACASFSTACSPAVDRLPLERWPNNANKGQKLCSYPQP